MHVINIVFTLKKIKRLQKDPWLIKRRSLLQRTGNVQRQPFGVAFSRTYMHGDHGKTPHYQMVRSNGYPSDLVAS